MTTYKAIKGTKIQVEASNPSPVTTGDIWYNSTTDKIQVYATVATGVWSTGGTLGTARYFASGMGTQTASLFFGGTPPVYFPIAASEEYNGSSWSAGGSKVLPRFGDAAAGTLTAVLVV